MRGEAEPRQPPETIKGAGYALHLAGGRETSQLNTDLGFDGNRYDDLACSRVPPVTECSARKL